MPNEVLIKTGTAIVFADTTDYSPTAANSLGTRTNQIDLTSLAAAAARQSDQVDLGATRADRYHVMAALEYATAPAAGEVVAFYWAASPNGTAATANPGGVSGSDAAYTGTSGDTLANSIKQLELIGTFVLTVDATTTVQIADVGTFSPTERYGTLVVYNLSAADNLHSDAVEMSVLLDPIIDEVQ